MTLSVFLIGFLMLSVGLFSFFLVRKSKMRFEGSKLACADVLGLCLALVVGGGVITFFGTMLNEILS